MLAYESIAKRKAQLISRDVLSYLKNIFPLKHLGQSEAAYTAAELLGIRINKWQIQDQSSFLGFADFFQIFII
jgi:hypothetical protein